MGVGEGGPEIVKQLLKNTYDIAAPQVVLVWLTGTPPHGVGPHDVAIALCGAVYGNASPKTKILEYAPLLTSERVAIVRADHPLPQKSHLHSDLVGEPLICNYSRDDSDF